MCNCCDPDYESLTALHAELLAKNDALENALKETLKCYREVSDSNVQLVITNAHLMKKVYYDNRT